MTTKLSNRHQPDQNDCISKIFMHKTNSLNDIKRKKIIKDHIGKCASQRDWWISKNRFAYDENIRYMQFLVPAGLRVLLIGSGTGLLLDALKPAYGVGLDISEEMVAISRNRYPQLQFVNGDIEDEYIVDALGGPFDIIILSDVIGLLTDCEITLSRLHKLCIQETRLIISYYSWLWEPVLTLAEKVGLKMPQVEMNWLACADIQNILNLAEFDTIKAEKRLLIPKHVFGIGPFINKYVGTLPFFRSLCLRGYLVARSNQYLGMHQPSSTVLIPCRNERGNIENAVKRIPKFCSDTEIIFVEGNSQDDTFEEIQRVIKEYPHLDIKGYKQEGLGKGDAVRKGFAEARGEVLMILDADLTVPPEDLPKFYRAITSGKGEYINGTRLIYPMEKQAMRFLNFCANSIFALLFTWLLNQRFTDTLCGTKVFTRRNYQKIVENRAYFGEFDPFGDFDLIFGATKLNLKVVEVPIRYAAREYGETQISRFRHGLLLFRMVFFAFRKLKGF